MRTRISHAKLYFVILAVWSALFPLIYFTIDPDVINITDRQNYEAVFSGDINADTAHYPLFLAIWLSISSITGNYQAASLFLAVIFSSSNVLLFGWQLGKSFKPSALYTLILSALVVFSYYAIKVAFVFKKLALGLFIVNLSFLTYEPSLIILLRVSAALVHPQLLPILALPNRVDNLKYKNPFGKLSQWSTSLYTIKWKPIARFSLLFLALAITILVIQNALTEYGDSLTLFIESLQYKVSYYLADSDFLSQLSLPLAVISFLLASVLVYCVTLSNMQTTATLYYISVLAYLISAMTFGTSRLFLLLPYLFYPLRSAAVARISILIFFGYACYRSGLVFAGAATFS